MRVAVDTLPPFLMGAVRFLLAGAVLAAVVAVRERPRIPTRREWGWALASGVLLLVGGNGGVVWAEARGVPTGVTALLAASAAIWMVVLDALRPGGAPPTAAVWLGLALGLAGVAVLVGPARLAGAVDPVGRRWCSAGRRRGRAGR
jgi:drug/metabolite transporter (DMT)-like permease